MQVADLRNYAERRGWTVTACIEDVGSGVKERPKRQELIKLAKRREIDGILVWRLDRWGRSVTDLIGSLQDLAAFGVGFLDQRCTRLNNTKRSRPGRNASRLCRICGARGYAKRCHRGRGVVCTLVTRRSA